MTDDRLLDRMRDLDPATPERIAAASRGTDELRREIEREEVDDLAIHRRARRHRFAVAIAAAAVTAALLVPLILLLPLGEDDAGTIGATPTIDTPTPTTEPTQSASPDPGPLDAIEVALPARDAAVTSPVTVAGTADVFEATVSIRIQDAVNNTIAETFATATCGTGCRGDFSVEVPYSVNTEQAGVIQVFEVSAMDGSLTNIVRIPVTLLPTADDPVATAVEGEWQDANGTPLPSGTSGGEPLVLHTSEGPEHCGWTSITFLTMGWPPGSEATEGGGSFRQYLRDPAGLLSGMTAVAFDPDAALPNDAVDTGLHRGDWQLWTAPSDEDRAVYVVNGDPAAQGVVERWTRATDLIACD